MISGKIHSWESMGLVDGPGIRTVVFLQGCRLRCLYCHNPDTWAKEGGTLETVDEVMARLRRFRPYYGTEGGVTFSGGEPLLQREFLTEILSRCRQEGIHTCLDTAGCGVGGYEEILKNTDLVLFDIKHYTEEGYRRITGQSPKESLRFLSLVQEMGIPLWLRHVVVPGLTDSDEHLEGLQRYIQTLRGVQRVELLPYHTLGVHKYERMQIPYPLKNVPPKDAESLTQWQERMNPNHSCKENKEENE